MAAAPRVKGMTDVTDATFATAVVERSKEVPVVLDLWAPWCAPCRTLGPILERVVAETGGRVELAKLNIEDNPAVADALGVRSIPLVYALRDGQVVDQFLGARPEQEVREFVGRLAAVASPADLLVEAGDEASLRQALELEPDHAGAVVALAALLVERGAGEEALALLARIPETPESRRVAATARLGAERGLLTDPGAVERRLDDLLERVKGDDAARREFLDILDSLGPDDPRVGVYRRALTTRLF